MSVFTDELPEFSTPVREMPVFTDHSICFCASVRGMRVFTDGPHFIMCRYCNVTKGGNTFSYTITIKSAVTVSYSDSQEAKIRVQFRNNTNNYYSSTCKVVDLINGNITNLVLTHE